MGSGIRNVSNPDGGSSLVNLRVALLEVTLKPSAKFSFFDSRFFRNGSMLIEQISATSIRRPRQTQGGVRKGKRVYDTAARKE